MEAKTALPAGFQFSQASLHDFETCCRRFELRYLRRLNWPGIESTPLEEAEHMAQLGTDFHRLVHQHLVGLEAEMLTATLVEPELKEWWQNYLDYRPAMLEEAALYPELTLSTPLRGYRLVARFDLLAVQGSTFWLVDWKTTRHKPSRDSLARRMQSRVYPYVLAAAGAAYNRGQAIDPAAIKMMYWYPQEPQQPEVFVYSLALMQRDEQFLSRLIEQVKSAALAGDFPLVEGWRPCLYCRYRSFCDRGDKAGPVSAQQEQAEADLDLDVLALEWDQIAEIQF